MKFENTIDLIECDIDSLKDAYHNEKIKERKTAYSSRILENLKAIKILKKQ